MPFYSHSSLKKHPDHNYNEAIMICCTATLTPFPEGDHTMTHLVIAPSSGFLGDVQSSWSGPDVAPCAQQRMVPVQL